MMRTREQLKRPQLWILCAVLGLVVVFAIVAGMMCSPDAHSRTFMEMNSICKAAKQYYDHHGVAPASMEEIQTYDDSVSTEDAWGRALTYSVEGTVIRLCSFGADGAEGGEGKDRDLVIEYCVKEDDYPRRVRREQGTR